MPRLGFASTDRAPVERAPKNFWGVLALIGGIARLLFASMPFGGVTALAGLVCGLFGLRAAELGLANNRGVSQRGALLSGIAIVGSLGFLAITVFASEFVGA